MIAHDIVSRVLLVHSEPMQEISLSLSGRVDISEWAEWCQKGKTLDIKITKHREDRSLAANAYFWTLVHQLAAKLETSNDELYLGLLERYGVGVAIIVKPEAVDRIKAEWRTVRELGRGKVGEMEGVQLYCYYGSKHYDSKEMARLIEGTKSECREVGIDPATPQELDILNTCK